jgi:hypothetical protein
VKTKRASLVIAFVSLHAGYLIGQIDCSQASATREKLVCQLPITTTNFATAPGVITQAQQQSAPINAAIGVQLTQLPIPSAAAGTVTLRQNGNPVPYDNLGPILTDRPDTIGKGRIYGGFSYQHFEFNAIDGIALRSLPFGYSFVTAPTQSTDASTTVGNSQNKIDFKLDQYVVDLTYGASPTTDVSLILPFNSVSIDATSSNPQTFTYDFASNTYSQFIYPASIDTTVRVKGSASGIGDISLGVKQMIHGQEGTRTAVSIGAALRLPTGDQYNYLGSGAYGFNAYALVSYRARLSPHLRIGDQWNGASPLVNTTTPNTHGDVRLPGGVQYDAGFDYSVIRTLTAAVDIQGSQFVNAPSLTTKTGIVLTPAPAQTKNPPAAIQSATSLSAATPINNTYTTVNLSMGLKYFPKPWLLLYGNVLIQLNNVGLRSDPVPLAGIAYTFRPKQH